MKIRLFSFLSERCHRSFPYSWIPLSLWNIKVCIYIHIVIINLWCHVKKQTKQKLILLTFLRWLVWLIHSILIWRFLKQQYIAAFTSVCDSLQKANFGWYQEENRADQLLCLYYIIVSCCNCRYCWHKVRRSVRMSSKSDFLLTGATFSVSLYIIANQIQPDPPLPVADNASNRSIFPKDSPGNQWCF